MGARVCLVRHCSEVYIVLALVKRCIHLGVDADARVHCEITNGDNESRGEGIIFKPPRFVI